MGTVYRTAAKELNRAGQKMIVFDHDKLIEDLINGLCEMPDLVEHFRRGDLSKSAA
jgi:hypothetical protein